MQIKVLLFTIPLAFSRLPSFLFHLVAGILGINFCVSTAELSREVTVVRRPGRVSLITKLWSEVIESMAEWKSNNDYEIIFSQTMI